MTCALCDNTKTHARGLCGTHYDRWRRWGDPFFAEVAGGQRRDLERRFWKKVSSGPIPGYAPHLGPCWLWQAAISSGYGVFAVSRTKKVRAHRLAYELSIGPIPDGLTLDHLCRVTRCVRPTHLEPVTMTTNSLRGISPPAQNARKAHCKHGHAFNAVNTHYSYRQGTLRRRCRACGRVRSRRCKLLREVEA